MSGYAHDVFLSWRRAAPVEGWFRRFFRREFEARLRSTLGHEPSVFVDEGGVDHGDNWQARLSRELRVSKLLVPVWEPQFFRSPWCSSELLYMVEREEALGYRSTARPEGLILPVVVRDGTHFREWLDRVQVLRMDNCLQDSEAFARSEAYLGFVQLVDTLCDNVERALEHVPEFSDDFPLPTLRAPLLAPTTSPMPRFR